MGILLVAFLAMAGSVSQAQDVVLSEAAPAICAENTRFFAQQWRDRYHRIIFKSYGASAVAAVSVGASAAWGSQAALIPVREFGARMQRQIQTIQTYYDFQAEELNRRREILKSQAKFIGEFENGAQRARVREITVTMNDRWMSRGEFTKAILEAAGVDLKSPTLDPLGQELKAKSDTYYESSQKALGEHKSALSRISTLQSNPEYQSLVKEGLLPAESDRRVRRAQNVVEKVKPATVPERVARRLGSGTNALGLGVLGATASAMAINALVKKKCSDEIGYDSAAQLAKYVSVSATTPCEVSDSGAARLAQSSDEELMDLCRKVPNFDYLYGNLVFKNIDKVKTPKVQTARLQCQSGSGDIEKFHFEVANSGRAYDFQPAAASKFNVKVSDTAARNFVSEINSYQVDYDYSRRQLGYVEGPLLTGGSFSSVPSNKSEDFIAYSEDHSLPPSDISNRATFYVGESLNVARTVLPLAIKTCRESVQPRSPADPETTSAIRERPSQ